MQKYLMSILFFTILYSCSNPIARIDNEKKGTLVPTCQLVVSGEKKFSLDGETAPRITYSQFYIDSLGNRILTLLNSHNNSIYFFDYTNTSYLRKISYDRKGTNAILGMAGYYIVNMDSIYIYNRPSVELVLADSVGNVKSRTLLHASTRNWPMYYPQYNFVTACPIVNNGGDLYLVGFSPINVCDSLISRFKYTARFNIANRHLDFINTYPREIYGNDVVWDESSYMQPYSIISPSGEMIHSYPESHDLYITDMVSGKVRRAYGGSNVAGTISSMDWERSSGKIPDRLIIDHYLNNDLYGAILFDPWRKVYYRFMQQGIKTTVDKTPINSKPIIVIIMDENLNYLGETSIGLAKQWHWTNSFVTSEGLNIEYIDFTDTDEMFLNFKIFTIKGV